VTRDLRVLALAGSLRREGGEAEETFTRRVLGWLIPAPRTKISNDAIADDALATGREIAGALQGRPGFRLRNTPDGRAVVISAAHSDLGTATRSQAAGRRRGEHQPILSVRSQALERLLVLTLAAFAVAAAVPHLVRHPASPRASGGCATRPKRRSTRTGGSRTRIHVC